MTPRSWLLVPATEDDLGIAEESGADALVVDLARAAGRDESRTARHALDAWLKTRPSADIWVQTHGGDGCEDDVQVLLRHDVGGLWVPDATNAAVLSEL